MPEWKAIATVQRPAKEYEQHYQQWAETADELLKAVKATPVSSTASGKVFPIAGFVVNINSGYGMRDGRMHYGVDLAAAIGVPILATQAGKVMVAQMGSDACGGQVEIQHSDGNGERICHASEILVQVGDQVRAGQVIAKVGSTGRSTGPHLHFERVEGGRSIDPTPYLKSIGSIPLNNGAENNVKPDADFQEKRQWDLSKIQVPFLSFVQQPQAIARNDPDRFTVEVWIQADAGAAPASGIIIREDGLILTNHHVIANGLLYVKLKDGQQFQGRTIASDQSLDLALVQLDGAAGLPIASLAQSANVKVGDTVKAIGSPMGSHWKQTEASVIATDSDCGLQALNGRCLRTPSGFLYPGNSGGPLLNDRGEVIGVNRAIQESSGEGVSIPIEVFRQQFKMP
jgi:S1-C subfamily serine protease